jgi:hypothetical protein
MQKLACWLYEVWLSKAVGTKQQPLVKLIDYLAGSSCSYCMAVRMFLIGVGSALVFAGFAAFFKASLPLIILAGIMLIALAVAFTQLERRYLCTLPSVEATINKVK